ncbi:MAG: hypothetical protein J6R32_03310 [Bacteroidales bacterium]|nr:hypothetical protein [Bacteroidales bacterium]
MWKSKITNQTRKKNNAEDHSIAGNHNKQVNGNLAECSKAVDFFYDNADLEKYYVLCDKGEQNTPKAKALRKTLEKRGYDLED